MDLTARGASVRVRLKRIADLARDGWYVEVGRSPFGGALFAVELPAGTAPYDEPETVG